MKQKDLCLYAMNRTSGYMKAIWKSKVVYLENKLHNMTDKEKMEEMK